MKEYTDDNGNTVRVDENGKKHYSMKAETGHFINRVDNEVGYINYSYTFKKKDE